MPPSSSLLASLALLSLLPRTLLLHASPTTCYNQHRDKRPQLLPEKRARTSHPADMDDLALCVLSEEVQGGFFWKFGVNEHLGFFVLSCSSRAN